MPAPDIATLYKIEQAVETGLAAILAAETGIACFTTFSEDELTTPRIEIVCELGAATGQYALPTINAVQVPALNSWDCNILIRYVTNVSARGASAAQHSDARGQIRAAMAVWNGLFTEVEFPYHCLGRPLDVLTSVDVNNDEDFDTSEMTFASPVNIRDEAWPTMS